MGRGPMSEENRTVCCGECGLLLADGTKHCPNCGSNSKAYDEQILNRIVFRTGGKFTHLGPGGKKKAKGRSREDVSGRTGWPVTASYTEDFEKNVHQHRVSETQPGGALEDIHLENVPTDRKPDSTWIMQQFSHVAAQAGLGIHRRYVDYDRGSGEFLIRLGRSTQIHRFRGRTVRRAIRGSRAARRRVRDRLRIAIRDPNAPMV